MRTIGLFGFPETKLELDSWTPATGYLSLHRKVIAAFSTRVEGAWAAYIKDVPGYSHKSEYQEVLDHGDKLSESMARTMFPYIPKELEYAD